MTTSRSDVKVPEGMLKATANCLIAGSYTESLKIRTSVLEAALQWLSEHPIVPTEEQALQLRAEYADIRVEDDAVIYLCTLWQRRMFRAEPEIPEEVKDLLMSEFEKKTFGDWNHRIIEAFVRGQRSKGSV